MKDELIHELEVMNRLERQQELMWLRGENIPEELIERIKASRSKVKQLMQQSDSKSINK